MTNVIVDSKKLRKFCTQVFMKLGVSKKDAEITSDVLVMSDLRGISSHGVARLIRYVNGIKDRTIIPNAKVVTEKETNSTAAINAGNGLGQPASYFGMNLAIKKAKDSGLGFVTVHKSNHYGIAAYYSMMALKDNLIGISMTNSAPLVVPTFSRDMMIGTNPISVAAPAKNEKSYVLDMATSIVPRGRLEVYQRLDKDLPIGWAVDEKGIPSTDTKKIIDNMTKTAGGGILPLGGAGELFSGYKGYGLSLLVDIFSGILSGSSYGPWVKNQKKDGKKSYANVGHFFGAIKIENFIDLNEFKSNMDKMILGLKHSNKAEGEKRVYLHGEKEFEKYDEHIKDGVPLQEKVINDLKKLANELGVKY